LGSSERAYPAPISTQRASWSSVRRSLELTRNHPGMSRPRMFHKRGFRRRHQGVRLRGIDADYGATLAAGGDGHVAADEEGEAAEHLLLGHSWIAASELPDTRGELLVVGHSDDRTDRRPRIPGERRARASSASTAPTTLPPSACPGQPSVYASVAAVTDLAAADLAPGTPHPDLARSPSHQCTSERARSVKIIRG
jgi:hypothetical protein